MSAATVRIFGLLAALAGACAPKPAPDAAPAAASVEAGAPTLEVGEVHRYALDWQTAATRKQGRTARAMRIILSAASTKLRKRALLEIIE